MSIFWLTTLLDSAFRNCNKSTRPNVYYLRQGRYVFTCVHLVVDCRLDLNKTMEPVSIKLGLRMGISPQLTLDKGTDPGFIFIFFFTFFNVLR